MEQSLDNPNSKGEKYFSSKTNISALVSWGCVLEMQKIKYRKKQPNGRNMWNLLWLWGWFVIGMFIWFITT